MGGRFVEEDHLGPMHEGEPKVEPALHAARVLADAAPGELSQPHALDQLGRARLPLRLRQPLHRALEAHVLPRVEQRVERGLLQRDDPRPHLGRLSRDVVTGHRCDPAGGRQQRREHVNRRRLAGNIRAQEAVDLAGVDDEVDPVDGTEAAGELADEALDDDAVVGRPPPGAARFS